MFRNANVGDIDRLLRVVFGLALLASTFLVDGITGWSSTAMTVVGLVMLFTAFVRFCPAYTILGINTCKTS